MEPHPEYVAARRVLLDFRILHAQDGSELVAGFDGHRAEPHAAAVSAEAVATLRNHGARREDELPRLAAEAVGGDPIIAASFAALAGELIEALPASA